MTAREGRKREHTKRRSCNSEGNGEGEKKEKESNRGRGKKKRSKECEHKTTKTCCSGKESARERPSREQYGPHTPLLCFVFPFKGYLHHTRYLLKLLSSFQRKEALFFRCLCCVRVCVSLPFIECVVAVKESSRYQDKVASWRKERRKKREKRGKKREESREKEKRKKARRDGVTA